MVHSDQDFAPRLDGTADPWQDADPKTISPAQIAEYVSFGQCNRYFKHSVGEVDRSRHHEGSDFKEAFEPLNLLLSKAGSDFEAEIRDSLATAGDRLIVLDRDLEEFIEDRGQLLDTISSAMHMDSADTEPVIFYQASIAGHIEDWWVAGDMDLVLIWPTSTGVHVRVIDVKSAREERTYHQIQAAAYVDLLQTAIEKSSLNRTSITIDAGIITRESDILPPTPDNLPSFDPTPRIADVRRLLAPDGELATIAEDKTIDEVRYRLDHTCQHCPYNEGCLTDAFEDGHTRLLGLSTAQQETLKEHGINTVSDLTDTVGVLPDADDWTPVDYVEPTFAKSAYKGLKTVPGIGDQLPRLLYQAAATADYLQEGEEKYVDRPRPWIPGTGRCSLPEDDPPESLAQDWQHGTMIRVYFNVQTDHLRDRLVQLSARVTATASTADPQRLSRVSDRLPDDPDASRVEEQRLLEEFINDLYDAIRVVAGGIDFSGVAQTDPPLHCYFYTSREQSVLEDAFNRHDSSLVESFKNLLEEPAKQRQHMVSALQPIVDTHIAMETPFSGLLPAYHTLFPPDDCYQKSPTSDGWSYTRPDSSNTTVDLRDVFNTRFFEYRVHGNQPADPSAGVDVDPKREGGYNGIPTRVRNGAAVPLGYIWAAIGRIDDDWVETVNTDYEFDIKTKTDIQSFRYRDCAAQTHKIDRTDLQALGRHLCDALEHVERSLTYRDATVEKEPYALDQLGTDAFIPPSLANAADQYLHIEHAAQREEMYELYRKFPEQRVLSGKSIPVQVTGVTEKNSRALQVRAVLRYDAMFQDQEEEIRLACRQKGSNGATSGSWMVATPYRFSTSDTDVVEPYKIEQGVQVTIDYIDLDNRDIVFTAHNFYGDTDEFGRSHNYWTTDEQYATPENNQVHFEAEQTFLLDPQTDDVTAARAQTALDHAETNALHDQLEALRHGGQPAPTTDIVDPSSLEDFAGWLENNFGPETLPSEEQRAFITDGNHQFIGLQGPPGTGKTEGTLAPAILSRAYAAAVGNSSLAMLVTAPSNTAIDELLSGTADIYDAYLSATGSSNDLSSVKMVRIADNRPADAPDHVKYIDYNDDDDAEPLAQLKEWITSGSAGLANGQTRLSQLGQDDPVQTIVFATPARSWRLVSKLASSDEPAEAAAQEYWDVLVADEASMLTLPEFLLAGAGWSAAGQVLVGGDHRQLPPVQTHDWDEETRRDIQTTVPYLSTQDYLRLLRGESDVLDLERRSKWVHNRDPTTIELPFTRLSTTYRFGSTTAEFAKQTVYKQDNIDYTSRYTPQPLPLSDEDPPDPLAAILDEDAPIVLVAYQSDTTFQQWNPIETAIIDLIVPLIASNASVGVVTPHNAQRSRVQAAVGNGDDGDCADIQVETVNRFQGSEANLMIMSATVSDDQYIAAESEFLLQQSRVNVGLTRHQDKLVVLAPVSLLGFMPADPDTYESSLLWKELASISGEAPTNQSSSPSWTGTFSSFLTTVGVDIDPMYNSLLGIYPIHNPTAYD